MEVVPPTRYTQYASNISITNALALLLGPIIGGAIASTISWRWIFIIMYVDSSLLRVLLPMLLTPDIYFVAKFLPVHS